MAERLRARQPAPHSTPARGSARQAPRAPRGTAVDSILALQAQAGNRAVTAMLQREAPQAAATPDPPPTGGAATETAPATTVAAPPTEGRSVDRLGLVDNDKQGGGGLNLRASPQGAVLTRLADNDHVMVKTDVGNDWYYVVATDGAARGTAGYASKKYINIELPPSPENPDPGAILYRIQGGERAHDVVRRHYGAAAIVPGMDQRFFTNVLQYVNEDAKRGHYLIKKIKMRGGSGGFFGSMPMPYEDIELVAGGKIWIPSLPFAQALKGKVSSGSLARDTWEKVKGFGEKLVAIPAFIGGLVVGALESVRDLIVGLFEVVWGLIKTAGGMLVDMASAIWGFISDPTKRQALFDSIDSSLQEMLYTGGLMKRAYNWGRIVGYATMEVVSFILFAGATAALKAGKFGARLAKVFEVIKQTEGVQKAIKAAEALQKTEAAAKIVGTVEKAAGVVGKVADKAEPATNAAKKVAGAVGKVAGAPGEAVLTTARVLSRQLRRIAAKYGWSESRFAEVLGIVEKRGATAYLRRSSKWAPARLAEGALPKPLPIKANTLDELDLLLGNGQFAKQDLGLVAHFEPVRPATRPSGMSKQRWDGMQAELDARYKKRLASYQKNQADMAKLTVPTAARDSTYFEIKGGDGVKGGLVYQVDIDDAGKAARHALTGDIDVLEFRTKGGKLAGPEYELLDELFLESGATEHGAHMAWRRRADFNEDAFYGILEGHLKDPVVEIGPGGKVREITAERVPGVAEILDSAEYKAWKAKKTGAPGAGAPPPGGAGGGGAATGPKPSGPPPTAGVAPQIGPPAPQPFIGPPAMDYGKVRLDKLRRMAEKDPAAWQALIDRYEKYSDKRLRALKSKGDQTAAAVLERRVQPNTQLDEWKGVKGDARMKHSATAKVTRPDGTIKPGSERSFESGGVTQEERDRLGLNKANQAKHTEVKAIAKAHLKQGETLWITGQYDPCPFCQKAMLEASKGGRTVVYWWQGGEWRAVNGRVVRK